MVEKACRKVSALESTGLFCSNQWEAQLSSLPVRRLTANHTFGLWGLYRGKVGRAAYVGSGTHGISDGHCQTIQAAALLVLIQAMGGLLRHVV